MSDMNSSEKFTSPYVFYEYMTEVGDVAYTRGNFKLHRQLGHAKAALKGVGDYRNMADSTRILYKWNKEAERWDTLYVFYPNDPVKW